MSLIVSCGQVKLKNCHIRVRKIQGENAEVCRYDKREEKLFCRKPKNDDISVSAKSLMCLKNNLDNLFESLNLKP